MAPYVEKAMNRVPATLTAGVKKFFCGPESFTPDLAVCGHMLAGWAVYCVCVCCCCCCY